MSIKAFKPFNSLEILEIKKEKKEEIENIKQLLSNPILTMDTKFKDWNLDKLNELLELAENMKTKHDLINFYKIKNMYIFEFSKQKMFILLNEKLKYTMKRKNNLTKRESIFLSEHELNKILGYYDKIINKLNELLENTLKNWNEKDEIVKIGKSANDISDSILQMDKFIFKKIIIKQLDIVKVSYLDESVYIAQLKQLIEKIDSVSSKLELSNLMQELKDINDNIQKEKTEKFDEKKINLKEEFNKLNISTDQKREFLEEIDNSKNFDELRFFNTKLDYYKIKNDFNADLNRLMQETIEFDNISNENYKIFNEVFNDSATNYVIKYVSEFDEFIRKETEIEKEGKKLLFRNVICDKLMDNPKFKENVKIFYGKDREFVDSIIEQLSNIYFKTGDEAYNPEVETCVMEFCLMSEEERNEKFRNAVDYSSGSKKL